MRKKKKKHISKYEVNLLGRPWNGVKADAATGGGVAVDFAVEEGGVGSGGDDGDGGAELGEEPRHVNHGDQVAMAYKWKENDVEFIIFRDHDEEEEIVD